MRESSLCQIAPTSSRQRLGPCVREDERVEKLCDDTATALARIPPVGYDFGKQNTNAEKGDLT
jgi:hypothetical protein